MNVTVLGAGASFPRPGGACSGYLVSNDDTHVWIDAGNGTYSRLVETISLGDLDALILTHVHADHISDVLPLMYALAMTPDGREAPLPLYAPGPVDKAVALFLGGASREMFAKAFDFRPMDGTIRVGGLALETFRTNHPIETYGLRISSGGRRMVYTSDTATYPELANECRDADLLICEATYVDDTKADPDVHMWAREAGTIAAQAGVKALVLTHILPTIDPAQAVAEAAKEYSGPVEAAVEGKRYTI